MAWGLVVVRPAASSGGHGGGRLDQGPVAGGGRMAGRCLPDGGGPLAARRGTDGGVAHEQVAGVAVQHAADDLQVIQPD